METNSDKSSVPIAKTTQITFNEKKWFGFMLRSRSKWGTAEPFEAGV
jgi:hypothetical protein